MSCLCRIEQQIHDLPKLPNVRKLRQEVQALIVHQLNIENGYDPDDPGTAVSCISMQSQCAILINHLMIALLSQSGLTQYVELGVFALCMQACVLGHTKVAVV